MEYFKKKKEINFEISAFTRKENLEAFLASHKIEILLLGEQTPYEDNPSENIKYIYQLTEKRIKEDDTEGSSVFKYQPVQMLLAEVLNNYNRKIGDTLEYTNSKSMKIISIFPPRPSSESILYAWSISILLSDYEKVLFVPLELLSIPLLSFVDSVGLSLSEFVYYLKENPNLNNKMKTLLKHNGYLSYLTGIMHGTDLLSLSREDIHRWVEVLNTQTDYKTVVFYLGFYSDAVIELMNISNSVLITTTGLTYEKAMLKEWELQMGRSGCNTNTAKFQKIELPEEDVLSERPMSLQELTNTTLWAAAMDYIKK